MSDLLALGNRGSNRHRFSILEGRRRPKTVCRRVSLADCCALALARRLGSPRIDDRSSLQTRIIPGFVLPRIPVDKQFSLENKQLDLIVL